LTLFDPGVSDSRLLDILDELGLAKWLAGLPDGLDTELTAGGGNLSAGQAQLLAFARVFLSDPGLVILDEASSHLDPATEQLIEHAVDTLLQGRTGLVIAHRLATVMRADEILILDEGRILERGQRDALARDPHSHFAHLLSTGIEQVLV
jgi:ATP-binding cassette subfamily B protein